MSKITFDQKTLQIVITEVGEDPLNLPLESQLAVGRAILGYVKLGYSAAHFRLMRDANSDPDYFLSVHPLKEDTVVSTTFRRILE